MQHNHLRKFKCHSFLEPLPSGTFAVPFAVRGTFAVPEPLPSLRPHFQEAVRLRRWDDAAKVIGLRTPGVDHFSRYLDLALEADMPPESK